MATNLDDIRLSEEQKRLIAERADRNGKPWQTILQEALASESAKKDDEGLDTEFMDWCAEQVCGKDVISLEEARRILAQCSGSLARDIIADREDRL
jgi:hypothetical protein